MLVLLVALGAQAQQWPAGETIPDAAGIHVTPEGFDAIAGLIPALVPTEPTPIDPTTESGGWSCLNYEYSLTDAWAGMRVTGARIVPNTGTLDVEIDLDVWLNDATDKFLLYYEVFCAGEDCPGYVDPFPVTVTVPFTLAVVTGADGKPALDATMGEMSLENGLASEHIHLDCNVDTLETALNYFGLSLYDLIIGLAEDQLKQELENQRAELEATLEEALSAARVDEDVDVNGVPLHVELYPRTVDVTPAGLALVMQGLADAPATGCVADFDAGGSAKTDSAAPAIADDPDGTHAGLILSDDFANQALYSLWRGGLLCYDLTDSEDVPIDLSTSMLGVLGGERFKELWPQTRPMIVRTEPRQPPVVDYEGTHDVTVQARDLGIEFFAELDHRTVHALGVALDPDIGVDLAFDGVTGELAVQVDLSAQALAPRVASNEFAPGTDQAIVDSFGGLIETLMDSLLGDALTDLGFALPAMDGLGLVSLDVTPAGDGDWMGAWAQVGSVDYTGGDGGCGGDTGGCSTGAAGGGLWTLIVGLVVRRRRGGWATKSTK